MKEELTVVYSSFQESHAPEVEFSDGQLTPYPDVPQRPQIILNHLSNNDFIRLVPLRRGLISVSEIESTHHFGMVEYLKSTSQGIANDTIYIYPEVFPIRPHMVRAASASTEALHGFYAFDSGAPIGAGTWQSVHTAATVAAESASLLIHGASNAVFALCRPPGHHAGSDFFGGYCYLNNAAIAVKRLLSLGKVAIVDIDYHHGNGTQEIFWDNPAVFVGSLHGDPKGDYPYVSGYIDETGGESALCTNVNIPLPYYTTGKTYLMALERLLLQIMSYKAQCLVVSIGFDTYTDDPIGSFSLDIEDYTDIGKLLRQLGLPTLFVLEGGYKLEVQGLLAESLFTGFLQV